MFSRYFLTLCASILFAAIIRSNAAEEPQLRVARGVQARNAGLAIAVRVLRQAFKWAAQHCLKEAAHNCKQHWKHPKALINCARGFLHTNKGRCVLG